MQPYAMPKKQIPLYAIFLLQLMFNLQISGWGSTTTIKVVIVCPIDEARLSLRKSRQLALTERSQNAAMGRHCRTITNSIATHQPATYARRGQRCRGSDQAHPVEFSYNRRHNVDPSG